MNSRELLSVGEVAERSGFAASALRYYEAEGLIHATRSPGGRRMFERSTLRRLAFIRAAANVGLTLQEIRDELAQLPKERTPTKADWSRISRHWRSRLDEQIAALESLRDGIPRLLAALVPIEPQPDTIAVPVMATWLAGLAVLVVDPFFRGACLVVATGV